MAQVTHQYPLRASAARNHTTLQETKMPTINAKPMSQSQADALRGEWALLLKMGYASQWTPAQKMARQDVFLPRAAP